MTSSRAAIYGRRSWIADALREELRQDPEREVWSLPKAGIGTHDLSDFDCVYAILGRARPTEAEAQEEERHVRELIDNPNQPQRIVYLSSRRLTDSKLRCETWLGEHMASSGTQVIVVRPPAVFGPGQSIDSPMLVPSLARDQETLELENPDRPTDFVAVEDLARHLAGLMQPWVRESVVPDTFTATPRQLRALWRTWHSYERNLR